MLTTTSESFESFIIYLRQRRSFWICDIKMVSFCAFWVVLFTVQLPVLHAKNGAFGLPELKLTVACAHAEMERETKTEREREIKGKAEIKV